MKTCFLWLALVLSVFWTADGSPPQAVAFSSEHTRLQACNALAAAEREIDKIPDSDNKSYYLEAIAEAQARAGDLSAALHTANHPKIGKSRASALVAIAQEKALGGDLSGARNLLDSFEPTVATIETVRAVISRAQAMRGDVSGALHTLQTSSSPRDIDDYTLEHIVYELADADHLRDAQRLADALKPTNEGGDLEVCWSAIAAAKARSGDTVDAWRTFRRIAKLNPTSSWWMQVAQHTYKRRLPSDKSRWDTRSPRSALWLTFAGRIR